MKWKKKCKWKISKLKGLTILHNTKTYSYDRYWNFHFNYLDFALENRK